jgi:hypothetical protein
LLSSLPDAFDIGLLIWEVDQSQVFVKNKRGISIVEQLDLMVVEVLSLFLFLIEVRQVKHVLSKPHPEIARWGLVPSLARIDHTDILQDQISNLWKLDVFKLFLFHNE